jgi:hypothetical protein
MAALTIEKKEKTLQSSYYQSEIDLVERILCDVAQFYSFAEKFQTFRIFDRENGHFILMDEGWEGHERIHRVWLHVEIKDNLFFIHEDGTEDGVTKDLLAAGIPKDRIVLAFQHPSRRKFGDFALGL